MKAATVAVSSSDRLGCKLVIRWSRPGWEQVSRPTDRRRCPELAGHVFPSKSLFWDEGCRVGPYHPPLSQYVKNHRYSCIFGSRHAEPLPAPPFQA